MGRRCEPNPRADFREPRLHLIAEKMRSGACAAKQWQVGDGSRAIGCEILGRVLPGTSECCFAERRLRSWEERSRPNALGGEVLKAIGEQTLLERR
jgi:hypothetical protein